MKKQAPLLLFCLVAGCFRAKPNIDVSLDKGVVLQMVRIEPGKFQMGSPGSEQERVQDAIVDVSKKDSKDEPRPRAKIDWVTQENQHDVEISKAFYIGIYEVTQEQYET